MNTTSNGGFSDPLCDSVNRGLKSRRHYLLVKNIKSIIEHIIDSVIRLGLNNGIFLHKINCVNCALFNLDSNYIENISKI